MPGDSGGPVVATLVCHHHTLRTRLRVQRAPAFPTPSVGRKAHAQLGRIAPRECGYVFDVIARSKATKQSIRKQQAGLLRFARNDGECLGSLKIDRLQNSRQYGVRWVW